MTIDVPATTLVAKVRSTVGTWVAENLLTTADGARVLAAAQAARYAR